MKFKFISLNLWYGGQLFNKIINFLNNEKADILVLQEAYSGKGRSLKAQFKTVEILKKNLNYQYHSFSPTFLNIDHIEKIESGNLIFSKYPIKASSTTFYDIPYGEFSQKKAEDFPFTPRNLQWVKIQYKNIILNVYNTQGIWGFDGNDNQRRLKMSETIVNNIKDQENVILAGDFNVYPNTKTIKNIEMYLKNIFKNKLKTTFNMTRKVNPSFATAVVDMVFVSSNIKVVEHYCPKVDISDHLPLVCRFEIK